MKFDVEKNRKVIIWIISIASILLLLYSIIPYLYTTWFIIPSADDFGFSNSVKEQIAAGNGYFISALKLTFETYFTWQGTYFCNFLLYITAPLVRFGIIGVRIMCFICILVFYTSIFCLIRGIFRYLLKLNEYWYSIAFFAMTSWVISNVRIPMEIFFWYNGVCAYTIPLACAFFGCNFMLKYMFDLPKKQYFVGAIILGLAACGGTLQHAAIICYVYLLFAGWSWINRAQGKKKILIVFGSTLLGAVINACAPGNFVRHGDIGDGKMHIGSALGYSLYNALNEMKYILLETDMRYVLIVVLFLGYFAICKEEQVKMKWIAIIMVALFGILWISNFPVALGYSSSYMEPRGYFVLDNMIVIGFGLWAFVIGKWIGQQTYEKIPSWSVMMILVVFLFVTYFWEGYRSEKVKPIELCIENCQNGYFERFRDMWEEILENIEESEEENVVVLSKHIPDPSILKNPDLSSDSTYWINITAAEYYEKESISIEWLE